MNYEELNGIVWLKRNDNINNQSEQMNSIVANSKENEHNKKVECEEYDDNDDSVEDEEEIDYGDEENEIILNDQDVWDDSILIQMYEQSQREIAEALRKKHLNYKNKNNVDDNNEQPKPAPPPAPPTTTTTSSSANNNDNKKKSKNKKTFQPKTAAAAAAPQNNNNQSNNAVTKQNQISNWKQEWRQLSELKPSAGNYFRDRQTQMAINDGYFSGGGSVQFEQTGNDKEYNDHHPASNEFMTGTSRIIPPPPPFFGLNPSTSTTTDNQSIMMNEEDTLASMLMSWYMTGYHTGYFQAQRDIRKSNMMTMMMNRCNHCRRTTK
ncbi:survival motor neuron isoform X2 [Dermatophagoides farinae]|uniref:survival motor neuron isoform X2 n=1 Tax=Dermatophagoides farinae TaxID=6954 RepID=UPI003F61BF43